MSWCIPSNLNTEIVPWNYRNLVNAPLPWQYQFTFNILDVEEVNDRMQTVTLAMYFRIKWLEPRLEINNFSSEWNKTDWKDGSLSYSSDILKQVWNPDLEIFGLKEFKRQSLLKEMSNAQIYRTHHIRYGVRAVATISCKMNFDRYPVDSQKCPFQVASYLYTENTVNCTSVFTYKLDEQRNLQYSTSIGLLPFKYQTVFSTESGIGKRFAACGFYLSLDRKRNQTFYQVYLTSMLFVVVSWASFLINPDIVPGRMGLLITIFLVLINIFNGAKLSAPVSTSLNAVDLYIIFCIGKVFLALSVYGVILFKDRMMFFFNGMGRNTIAVTSVSANTKNFTPVNKHSFNQKLDAISFIVFPIMFIIFNIIYWTIYF
jgi:hypothetical protein